MKRAFPALFFLIFIIFSFSFSEKPAGIDFSVLKIHGLEDTAFSNSTKVSIPLTIAQSLLLPAYGSYKSESYLLSSFQLCMDLAPVFLLLTSDWSGEKSMGLIALPLLPAINRVLAIPLNGFSAFVHNYRIDQKNPVCFLPTFSDKSHFGLVLFLGSDYSIPVDNGGLIPGISIKFGHLRTTISIPNSSIYGGDEYESAFGGWGFNDEYCLVKYRSGAHLTATVDYRLRVHKCVCINPGLTVDFFESSYRYYRFIGGPGGQEQLVRDFGKMSYLTGPKVSLEVTRFNRFTIEHTLFLPVFVERNYRSYNKDIGRKIPPMIYTLSMNVLMF
jgi:hypothetical protein